MIADDIIIHGETQDVLQNLANFERPLRGHFSLDSRRQAILVFLITRPLQRCISFYIFYRGLYLSRPI